MHREVPRQLPIKTDVPFLTHLATSCLSVLRLRQLSYRYFVANGSALASSDAAPRFVRQQLGSKPCQAISK